MRLKRMPWVVIALCIVLAPLSAESVSAVKFQLFSKSFTNGAGIPARHGCGPERDWKKPSLPLNWEGAPTGTQSFTILMYDLHPVAQNWVHWLVSDIPAGVTQLTQGASGLSMPPQAKEYKNTFGNKGYGAPCPPSGTHRYRIEIYALPTESLSFNPQGKTGEVLSEMLAKRALAVARLEGIYP